MEMPVDEELTEILRASAAELARRELVCETHARWFAARRQVVEDALKGLEELDQVEVVE